MGKYKDMDPGFHYKPIGGYGKITAVPMPTIDTVFKKKKKKSNEAIIQEFKARHKSLLQGYKK